MNDAQLPFEERKWKHELEIERQKWLFETNRDDAQRVHDAETEFGMSANAAAVKNAEEAIKAAILINGGSSVAMLAFIGTLVSRDFLSPEQLSSITRPLIWFGSGVATAMIASAAAYFVNLFVADMSNFRRREYEAPFVRATPASKRRMIAAEVFRWVGILAMTGSIACFVTGLVTANAAFKEMRSTKPAIVTPAHP
jgi:hypothetical protein